MDLVSLAARQTFGGMALTVANRTDGSYIESDVGLCFGLYACKAQTDWTLVVIPPCGFVWHSEVVKRSGGCAGAVCGSSNDSAF